MNLKEIGRPALWFVIGLAVAAVPFYLYRTGAGANRAPAMVVRSYSVAPGIAREVQSALSDSLVLSGSRVSLLPDGRIVVTATESVQKGVEQVLAEVAAQKPTPTPAIHFDLWLVSAVPGAAASDEPGLAEVGPALADIQKSQGPLRFKLIEKLALQARAGNSDSRMEGAHADMQIVPTVRQDAKGEPVVAAMITVRIAPRGSGVAHSSLKALTEMHPGQLLVIGQSSLAGNPPSGNPPSGNAPASPESQVYYIVRASL